MNKTTPILAPALALMLASVPVMADQAGPAVGEQTRSWLELQASGAQASAAERPMQGEVAERVYQRYLDSFTHPIPERFPREAFTDEGE